MIVFVFCPKPFLTEPKYDIIQKNSILSVINLNLEKKIVLVGDDFGVKEFTEKHNLIHEEKVEKGVQGTPLVKGIFQCGLKHAGEDDLICYMNSDIIVYSGFEETINALSEFTENNKKILYIGQRYDWPEPEELDLSNDNWKKSFDIESLPGKRITAIDYFIFKKDTYNPTSFPNLAIGRWHWDRWLVHKAFTTGSKVVDLTETLKLIHQKALYHCAGKFYKKLPFDLPETKLNINTPGGLNINESQYILTKDFKIRKR